MKITLKNFRCYENSTFDFGSEGIALLSGGSGTGKTSILLGIYFALFGTGSKLVMYGKTSCNVVVEFNGMTITRSKRPNRLVVLTENEYEDDAAQSIINEKFGDTFKTTGYISQNARDSFILMSPIEKLEFLEKFSFQDINLTQIKKRCKDLISERNEQLLKTTSQLEIATSMLGEMSEPDKIPFPLECLKKNREKSLKNEIIKDKNTEILIKRCKKKIGILQNELHSLQVLNAQIQSKQDSLDSVIEKLRDLSLEENKINYEGDEKIDEYEEQLSVLLSHRELRLLQNRYDEDQERLQNMKDNESDEKQEKIEKIEESLWKEYTEDECKDTINDYKQIIKDIEKLTELEFNLDRYKVDEEQLNSFVDELEKTKEEIVSKKKLLDKLEMQQDIFQCPSCSIQLRFRDSDLYILENSVSTEIYEQENIDTVTDEISKLKRKITMFEKTIPIKQNNLIRYKELSKSIQTIKEQYDGDLPQLSEMTKDLDYIKTYYSSQQELSKQLKSLISNESYSSTIMSFEKSVKKQLNRIESLKKETKIIYHDIDEEELRKNIVTQTHNKEKLENIRENTNNLGRKQNDYEKQLDEYKNDHIEKYKKIRDVSTVENIIKNHTTDLTSFEETKAVHEKNVENIKKYQEYKKTLDIYNSWKEKVEHLKKDEIENRKLYGASTLMKEKILEAESISMLNVISSINTHTHTYLEAFFPDNPISVKLVPFKESKKGKTTTMKAQINLQIEYKGMEADINMLSGGELSRVILSFALALGEMFNTPMMLLDECTSSLDQELTGIVMDGIRENFNGKLVLIIAHQVVKGQFDQVITIEK